MLDAGRTLPDCPADQGPGGIGKDTVVTDQEHTAQVVREHVSAHEALASLLRMAADELDPHDPAVKTAWARVKAADKAYAADLALHGRCVPHGLSGAA